MSLVYCLKKLVPPSWLAPYHWLMALAGALVYRFPGQGLYVIGVTGTKGKTTTVELVNAILEATGNKTAIVGTLRFKIGSESQPNLLKMTMPGRFFLQRFLRQAVITNCQYAIIEMTSEGTKQFRHKFLFLNALIFTNLSPEHIESHGSYANYVAAKLKIAEALAQSSKPNKVLVVNNDDQEAHRFLAVNGPEKITYSLKDWSSLNITPKLPGEFNQYNILAAAAFAKTQNVAPEIIKQAVEKVATVRGRLEKIIVGPEQKFDVIIDYAHTVDSLEKVYQTFPNRRKICVLGGTGGGRDQWKRKKMGKIADQYCAQIILTNEDPYDEDPRKIVAMVAEGINNKTKLKIIMNRREAVHEAVKLAQAGDIIIITGKGTDPFIMGPRGTKTPWDDATVVREEISKIIDKKQFS